MTSSYQITLKIKDMKTIKVGRSQSEFYLIAFCSGEIEVVTSAKDILFSDEPFVLPQIAGLDKIEVWDYNLQRKMVSLHIKGSLRTKTYSYEFTRANLTVEIKSALPDPRQAAKASKLNKGASISTVFTAHSPDPTI